MLPDKPIKISFGDFAPDLNKNTPGALFDMSWVWSTRGGWRVMEYPVPTTAVLPSTCYGAFQYPVANSYYILEATANQLYVHPGYGGTISQGLTLTSNPNLRSFTVYGNDLIVVD